MRYEYNKHKRHSAPFSGAWSDFPLVVYYYTVEYFSRTRNLERRPFATLRTRSTISDSALGKCHPPPLTVHTVCWMYYCIVQLCINRVSRCSTVYSTSDRVLEKFSNVFFYVLSHTLYTFHGDLKGRRKWHNATGRSPCNICVLYYYVQL